MKRWKRFFKIFAIWVIIAVVYFGAVYLVCRFVLVNLPE